MTQRIAARRGFSLIEVGQAFQSDANVGRIANPSLETRTDWKSVLRQGFTLIELLVVLAIIGVLVGLSAAALFRIIDTQHAANTRSALARVQSQLDARWSEVTRQARDESIPETLWANADFVSMAGTDANAVARGRVVYVKLRQRQAFPMTFDEALNPYPLPPLKAFVADLKALGVSQSTTQTRAHESAVCLLMALDRTRGGGVKGEEVAPTALLALPGGQASYLVDSWGTPLAFCRWPTGDARLNRAGPAPGRNDPGDPEGLLNVPAWLATPGAAAFRRLCHDLPPRTASAGSSSYHLTPLVTSAGPDRRLELDLQTFRVSGAGAKDNLTSAP